MGKKETQQELAAGYSPYKRALEYWAIGTFSFLWLYEFIRVARFHVHSDHASNYHLLMMIPSIFLALAMADFFSGLVHWMLDTWGSTETVVFGPFIRSFREHHVDQMAITRHDFVETNGDNTLVTLPVLGFAAWVDVVPSCYIYGSVTWHTFILFLTLVVAMTNQCHKWSHQAKPDAMAKFLMSTGLLLTPQMHRQHHKGEFDISYCITNGWLNGPLDRMQFWRKLENWVTATTGAIPRANDLELLSK